ncbi:MAG: DUF2865 domain-containing protein [Hyphomicrobiaceae bacterium]|nr:DUF2865 domain-containing protein [Hyphomicrobiaceae bacterium]
MIKAPKVEIATFFYRTGLSKTQRSAVSIIFSIILSVLFWGVPLVGSGQGMANAQSYRAQTYRTKLHRAPQKIAYNTRTRRSRGRTRRYRMVRKQKKSFFSELFGSSQKKRRSPSNNTLFGGFKLPGFLKKSPGALRSSTDRNMRSGVQNGRGPKRVTYGNGVRGWNFDQPSASGLSKARSFGKGRYRTMCVRLCDGYYYPVSFKTSSGQLSNDEARCNSGCYEAPTKLFYYSNPGGSIENMRALDGQRYKDLANAFRYRKEYVADCRCKAEPWSRQARAQHESWANSQQQAQLIRRRDVRR